MKAMILAAGRGKRLRPLTDTMPKPLVKIQGRSLIEHHLERLATSGFRDIVINVSYLAEKIQDVLGNGQQFGVTIHYSYEEQALETGGGIFNALALLGEEPFLAVNSDIWTDYPFQNLKDKPLKGLAHLVLFNQHSGDDQDFGLEEHYVTNTANRHLTYTGIAVYSPRFFYDCRPGVYSVMPLLEQAMVKREVTGENYTGHWCDVGTMTRLEALNSVRA